MAVLGTAARTHARRTVSETMAWLYYARRQALETTARPWTSLQVLEMVACHERMVSEVTAHTHRLISGTTHAHRLILEKPAAWAPPPALATAAWRSLARLTETAAWIPHAQLVLEKNAWTRTGRTVSWTVAWTPRARLVLEKLSWTPPDPSALETAASSRTRNHKVLETAARPHSRQLVSPAKTALHHGRPVLQVKTAQTPAWLTSAWPVSSEAKTAASPAAPGTRRPATRRPVLHAAAAG